MGYISPNKPAASCVGCFAWGVLPGRYCRACYTFGQLHQIGECAFCRRMVPTKKGYCRLCWLQASLEAKGQVTVLEPFLRGLTHQQLFLSRMHRIRQLSTQPGPLLGKQGRRKGRRPPPDPVATLPRATGWIQLPLPIEVHRDFARFNRREHADLTNPFLTRARQAARQIGEARGWTTWVTRDVDRALVILLSQHTVGDKIRWSELFPVLRRYGLSVERTVEVLDDLGLFDDDRVPAFESWLERKLSDLTPGIRADVEHWLRTLRGGGPRSRARSHNTPWAYLLQIHSVLLTWSDCYDHLREITHDDILAIADSCQGAQRHHTLSALRSLFRHCKKNGTIFKDPAARIRIGEKPRRILLPLQPAQIEQAVQAATTPVDRLVLALAAIHAARPKAIRELRLDDVDVGNRRITIAGKAHPLDDLTRDMVINWLEYRRARWPNTANLHLIINQQTAMETGPVRGVHMTDAFRGQTATLDRLRMHRQLDEALHVGPDPLHLAAVFGLDPKTAIRYADNARQLLTTTAEEHEIK